MRKNKENEDGDLLNVFWNEPRKGRDVGLEKHFATKADSKALQRLKVNQARQTEKLGKKALFDLPVTCCVATNKPHNKS